VKNKTKKAEQKKAGKLSSDNKYGLEVITPLVKRLNSLEIATIAEVCVTDIPKVVGVRLVSFYIPDEVSGILHLEKNNHPFVVNNIVSLSQTPPGLMVTAVQNKELLVINDIQNHCKPNIDSIDRPFAKNYETGGCIVVPLVCQGRVVGVLNLADKIDGKPFDKEDEVALELLRQLIGASIGNINLFEKTQRQAQTDGLTGMLNHITFYETLEGELKRSQRHGGQLSTIMADVDNLKFINDTYGHKAGDLAIKLVSRRIKSCIRQIDIAARYGGDEFSIILPSTSLDEAVIVAERMVEMVASKPMVWEENEIPLSISVGVGLYDAENYTGDIAKATDQALYAAKQAGKNTVKVFDGSTT
jgi:diguanylate cyclase (GGDEF)-like protein